MKSTKVNVIRRLPKKLTDEAQENKKAHLNYKKY